MATYNVYWCPLIRVVYVVALTAKLKINHIWCFLIWQHVLIRLYQLLVVQRHRYNNAINEYKIKLSIIIIFSFLLFQVCVKECPTEMFELKCTRLRLSLAELKSKLICDPYVNMNAINSCEDAERLANENRCAPWYLPSDSSKSLNLIRFFCLLKLKKILPDQKLFFALFLCFLFCFDVFVFGFCRFTQQMQCRYA